MAFIIPKETLEKWKSLRGAEDVSRLATITGLKRSALYYVLRTGKCSKLKVAGLIMDFHANLEKEINTLKEQLEDQD